MNWHGCRRAARDRAMYMYHVCTLGLGFLICGDDALARADSVNIVIIRSMTKIESFISLALLR